MIGIPVDPNDSDQTFVSFRRNLRVISRHDQDPRCQLNLVPLRVHNAEERGATCERASVRPSAMLASMGWREAGSERGMLPWSALRDRLTMRKGLPVGWTRVPPL